jgi:hypothetical protein
MDPATAQVYADGMLVALIAATAVLTPHGLGEVRTGMTERQVEKAIGEQIEPTGPNGNACTIASFSGRNYLIFSKGRLRRVSVVTKRYETRKGVGVGDPVAKVTKLYPGAKRSPHVYDPKGAYFDVIHGRRGLRFETDAKKVTQIHGGRMPELAYVEACS